MDSWVNTQTFSVLRQRMMVAEFVGRQQSCSPGNGEISSGGQHHNPVPMSPRHMEIFAGHDHVSPLSPRSPGPEGYGGSRDGANNGYDLGGHLKRKELFTQRKQREFIPDNKKDDSYWDRRRRNNEAAKRSREKRRFNDMVLEQRVVELTKENHVLKAQLEAIKDKYNICGESLVSVDQIMATLPNADQVLTITKRAKLIGSPYPHSQSPARHQVAAPVAESPPPDSHHQAMFAPHPPLHPALHRDHHSDVILQHQHPPIHAYAQREPSTYPHHQTPVSSHHVDKALSPSPRDDALNLSRRGATSPYDVSSGSCASGTASGDDDNCCDHSATLPPAADIANSLPLKLRHKSHLGDKDAAASALLALHHIKQEPLLRASPPWADGEGSSDERDSGISVGHHHHHGHGGGGGGNGGGATGEPWMRKIVPGGATTTTLAVGVGVVGILDKEEENIHLKSQLARLENEVASIKNMMILNNGATAAAQ
ncbi:nuclear factor interleukin-3-regulated protein-like isoform X2 [Phlebotomus papatasi]|uniref:nuclear factor interleukin-3-regulated protein-like isoform X2 n=1 Tax=Phlebotomus papatasi TaxID=29031 RepID=UPI002483A05E|nr:nuclear factor interleukin-3-regulated protein-like isoform X2 [Phlebotomus papatasi]